MHSCDPFLVSSASYLACVSRMTCHSLRPKRQRTKRVQSAAFFTGSHDTRCVLEGNAPGGCRVTALIWNMSGESRRQPRAQHEDMETQQTTPKPSKQQQHKPNSSTMCVLLGCGWMKRLRFLCSTHRHLGSVDGCCCC